MIRLRVGSALVNPHKLKRSGIAADLPPATAQFQHRLPAWPTLRWRRTKAGGAAWVDGTPSLRRPHFGGVARLANAVRGPQ
eukprot:352909-Chlamydomonas_euryale.AAC.5